MNKYYPLVILLVISPSLYGAELSLKSHERRSFEDLAHIGTLVAQEGLKEKESMSPCQEREESTFGELHEMVKGIEQKDIEEACANADKSLQVSVKSDQEVQELYKKEKKEKKNRKWYRRLSKWIKRKVRRRRPGYQEVDSYKDLSFQMAQTLNEDKGEDFPIVVRSASDKKDTLERRGGMVFSDFDGVSSEPEGSPFFIKEDGYVNASPSDSDHTLSFHDEDGYLDVAPDSDEGEGKQYKEAWTRKYSGDDPSSRYANVFPVVELDSDHYSEDEEDDKKSESGCFLDKELLSSGRYNKCPLDEHSSSDDSE